MYVHVYENDFTILLLSLNFSSFLLFCSAQYRPSNSIYMCNNMVAAALNIPDMDMHNLWHLYFKGLVLYENEKYIQSCMYMYMYMLSRIVYCTSNLSHSDM